MLYGRWLAKTWGIDPKAKTPAYTMRDGVDYTPAPGNMMQLAFAAALFVLGVIVAGLGFRRLADKDGSKARPEMAG